MKMCKIPKNEVRLMLQTLDQIQIAPGLDNADMYVGLGLKIQTIIENAEDDDDGRTDG